MTGDVWLTNAMRWPHRSSPAILLLRLVGVPGADAEYELWDAVDLTTGERLSFGVLSEDVMKRAGYERLG